MQSSLALILEQEPGLAGFVVVALLGLVFGSFATMASYRLVVEEDTIVKRSHCTKCDHPLGLKDLFPLFSWLLARGKCRYCKAPVSPRYPLIELAMAGGFLTIYALFGPTLASVLLWGLWLNFIIFTVTDLEHYIIPDQIHFTMLPFAIGWWYISDYSWVQLVFGPMIAVGSALLLRWIFFVWKKKEALGLGDVKLLGVLAIMLPLQSVSIFLFIAGVLGIVFALLWRVAGKGERFPFGPALGFACIVCLMFPELYMWLHHG